MELLNRIMRDFPTGLGAGFGWMMATLFLGHCTVARSVGNGFALLGGWVLGSITMHFLGKLRSRNKTDGKAFDLDKKYE